MNFKKDYYDVGQEITLNNGDAWRTFTILDPENGGNWYKQGGSALCFDAMYVDGDGNNHYGKLKKFYLDDETLNFDEQAEKYISPYKKLLRMVSDDQGTADVYTFVPSFEIYYDSLKRPHIWTNFKPMLTFQEICEKLFSSADSIENVLFEIVKTIKELTDCIRVLHEMDLVHGDINPTNFGFYYRKEKLLAEGVCLFDLDTLQKTEESQKHSNPPYYPDEPLESELVSTLDIQAIGVTLCKALFCSNDQIETIRKENNPKNEYSKAIARNALWGAQMFQKKGIPSDTRIQEALLAVVTGTVTLTPAQRFSSCLKLYQSLQRLEVLLLPYMTGKTLKRGYGLEIVNREENRRIKDTKTFQRLLYTHPLYETQNNDPVYRILLLGFGADSQRFLDLCLETAQSMDVPVEVNVWDDVIDLERKIYLSQRPSLQQFFCVDQEEEKLTGESYGTIIFHEFKGKTLEQRLKTDLAVNHDARYIYVAIDTDDINAEWAYECARMMPEAFVACQCEYRHEYTDSSVCFVPVNENVSNDEHEDEITRMAFNTHLVWSESLNQNLDKKWKEFLDPYNYNSCVSELLAIKYRLHYLDINMTGNNYNAAGSVFSKMKADPEKKKDMIAAEHRRWVTEKICDGWKGMSVAASIPFNSTKDKNGKRHICILRSTRDMPLKTDPNWRSYKRLDTATSEQMSVLDELDRMSVQLHQAYDVERLSAMNQLLNRQIVDTVLDECVNYTGVYNAFLEWYEVLTLLVDSAIDRKTVNVISRDINKGRRILHSYRNRYQRLEEAIAKINCQDELIRQNIENNISIVYKGLSPLEKYLEYRDFKQSDTDLIESIPFILTYDTESAIFSVPESGVLSNEWETTDPTALFSCIASSIIINPKDLYLLTEPMTEEEQEKADKKLNLMSTLFRRKGIHTIIHLLSFDDAPAEINRLNALNKRILLDQSVSAFLEQEIIGKYGTFTFNMCNQTFKSGKNQWISYIQRDAYISSHDIACLMNREFEQGNQPFFRLAELRTLFKIYLDNRSAWRALCKLLKENANREQPIIKFRVEGKQDDERSYFLPYECYKAVSQVISLLKNHHLIDLSSNVKRYSFDECKVSIKGYRCNAKKMEKVFSQLELLTASNEFSMKGTADGICTLYCEGLKVKHIPFDFYEEDDGKEILKVLQKLQKGGFLRFFITDSSEGEAEFEISYGSRQIKQLFMQEGNLLELYVHHKSQEMPAFHDVTTSLQFWKPDENVLENEFDCFITKGFKTMIVECKARSFRLSEEIRKGQLREIKQELSDKVRKFGINGIGVLVIDSEIEFENVDDPYNVITIQKASDIQNIGSILVGIMNRPINQH